MTPQRLGVETAGVEPAFPRCKRGARPLSYVPDGQCERVESNHHSAGAAALQAAELAGAQRSHARRKGDRPDSNRHLQGSHPWMLPLHHGHHDADDRTRTGGLSVDSRALCSSELRPPESAGGIRTHGLELMRLAGTAAPPLRICPAGVEPAVSGSRNRRGGRLPYRQSYPRRESNPRLPG